MTIGLDSLENIHSCIERAEKVCTHEVEVSFYSTNGRLGSNFVLKHLLLVWLSSGGPLKMDIFL